MQVTLSYPVPLSAVQKDGQASIASVCSYIRKLDKTTALILCSKLNLLTATGRIDGLKANHAAQTDALNLLLTDGLISDQLFKKLQRHRAQTLLKTGQASFVFSRSGILELIRYLSLYGSDATDSSRQMRYEHVQKSFFCALLACSDLSLKRHDRFVPVFAEQTILQGEALEEFRRNYQPMMRLAIEFAPLIREPLNYLGRARMLLVEEFFGKNSDFVEEFVQKHDGLTIDEYTACAAAIMFTSLAKMRQEKQFDSLANAFSFKVNGMFPESEHMRIPFQKYLNFKSQTVDELSVAFGVTSSSEQPDLPVVKPLRERPILRTGAEAIVFDEKLFAESVSVGPMFSLLGPDKVRNREIFAAFGMACHRYAYKVVEACNKVLPTESQALSIINEPEGVYVAGSKQARSLGDIAIVDKNQAALFETKGSWFNEAALKSVQSFWTEISRLYGISSENGRTKRRGYAQLADAIRLLSDKSVIGTGSSRLLSDVVHFFPVLLAHDELMIQPHLAHLLAIDFAREFGIENLPETGMFTVGERSVHSLIVLSFDDLEMLQARTLEKSINTYFREYSSWNPDRTQTINEFFAENYPGIRRRSAEKQLLLTAATKCIDDVAQICFGVKPK